ncbi:helix-turn-helix domain-containing protein [Kibdelosporangium persicum]|uniref:Transcriptional activator NphR n=1 Tax=Kibdelosporangium persicum TaxID=2698649 RepID=A0ABX2F7X1_9PSEU|nr:helix-turn-helix domain-containing protein [Kibdelosporangium persicum]NRN67244.1 Transcriptional activator NphR [Kibdelosporangium persicum]
MGVKVLEFEFTTEDLPAPDQFDYVRAAMSDLPAPHDASTDHIDGFRLHQRKLNLDLIWVWTMAVQPITLRRTARLIRQADPETYNLVLVQHGTIGRTWSRHEATYGPHDLHVNDSSQPYVLRAHSTQGLVTCIGVEIPKKLLSLPVTEIDHLVGKRLPSQGIAALLGGFLVQLTTNTSAYRPSDGPRLGTVLTDLTSALFAHTLETDSTLAPDSRQRTLILRIRTFIQQHLHDPRLTPGMVAAAHHISTSYLHRLFQRDGTTVAAWIREQRLKRARRDLTDPALTTASISHIAAQYGFTHPAAFSRAFRTAYGIAPKDYRHQARADGSHPEPAPR